MKKWDKKYWVGIIGILLLTIIGMGQMYSQQPIFVVKNYISAINKGDFELAYRYLHKNQHINDSKKEEVIACMENYFGVDAFIKLQLDTLKGKDYTHKLTKEMGKYFEVSYLFKSNRVKNGISLVKGKNQWEIVFPFAMTDVAIDAPLGATVYFDGNVVQQGVDGTYSINNLLPGEYQVRIQLYQSDYNNYVATMKVPEQKQVSIPYETQRVQIKTPKNMIVELAGEKKMNKGGTIFLDNVLQGAYQLKVIDPYGHFQTWSQTIEVSKDQTVIEVDKLAFSKSGENKVETYMSHFYEVYDEAIEEKKSDFLDHYMTKENKARVEESFENWFIKNKNVQDAEVVFDIDHIDTTEEGYIMLSILEQIDLMNKEKDRDKQEIDRYYRVVMQSDVVLEPVGESYIILDKKIRESLVSYKDESGKWIAY